MQEQHNKKVLMDAADLEQIRNESENAAEKLLMADYDPKNSGLGLATLANLFFIEKKYDLAEKKYLQAMDEGYDDAVYGLIKVYQKLGKRDLAEKYLIVSSQINKDKQNENNVEVGNLYFEEKKYIAAERYYRKAIEENYREGYVGLGKVFIEQKKYPEAQKQLLMAIEKGATSTGNHNLGYLCFKEKKYHDAEKYYLRALQNNYMPAALALGEMFTKLNIPEKAEHYLKIAGDETKDPNEMITIGDFYLQNKQFDNAKK
jgi:tetratricopeptide (TPR) repeat protein